MIGFLFLFHSYTELTKPNRFSKSVRFFAFSTKTGCYCEG